MHPEHDLQALYSQQSYFGQQQRHRLHVKWSEGFTGWNNKANIGFLLTKLHAATKNLPRNLDRISEKELIDIANFAMFLHYHKTQK